MKEFSARRWLKWPLAILLYYSGFLLLFRSIRRLLRGPVVAILKYHRVFPRSYRSIYELGVHEDVFEAQIRYISRTHRILCLSDFLANRYPDDGRDAAIITFDDGYLDNYLQAYPILTKYRVPATIFVVSGLVGTDGNLWNDLLVNYLEAQHEASTVRFDEVGGAFPISTFEQKRQSFYEMKEKFKTLPTETRSGLLEPLQDYKDSQDLILSWSHLREMLDSELIEIGGHTVSHELLTSVSIEDAEEEISQSKSQLERGLGRAVVAFAYPNGGYNQDILRKVKDSGYLGACTTCNGLSSPDEDRFALSRKGTDSGVCLNVWGGFSRALFAVETSGLFDILFMREAGSPLRDPAPRTFFDRVINVWNRWNL